MAAQAAMIAGVIAGIQQALTRHENSASDSDEPYLQPSNRGNKLKRKAHGILDRRSGRTTATKVYKRSIEHAGYHRDILRRNPKRYDDDGDELADSNVDEYADARAAEENPYAELHLEKLLMPLTSPAKLPKHPSLAIAYTSPILTNMAQHACEMVRRERKTLTSAKRLMTKLRGDECWIPCERVCSERDDAMFDTKKLYNGLAARNTASKPNGIAAQTMINGQINETSLSGSSKSSHSGREIGSASETIIGIHEDSAMDLAGHGESADLNKTVHSANLIETRHKEKEGDEADQEHKLHIRGGGLSRYVHLAEIPRALEEATRASDEDMVVTDIPVTSMTGELRPEASVQPNNQEPAAEGAIINGDKGLSPRHKSSNIENHVKSELMAQGNTKDHPGSIDAEDPQVKEAMDGIGGEESTQPEPRRMRTRAQAQAASEPTVSSRTESPDPHVATEIHPIFKIPESAIPDGDFGLPPHEAEETRRLLTMYVQKQEEICRGATKLYEGLLRADRQRSTVLKWCKAEDHVGEMSDGEDWYDKEEWGLDEDLEKGRNEEEGDNNAIQGRKPRRRA